ASGGVAVPRRDPLFGLRPAAPRGGLVGQPVHSPGRRGGTEPGGSDGLASGGAVGAGARRGPPARGGSGGQQRDAARLPGTGGGVDGGEPDAGAAASGAAESAAVAAGDRRGGHDVRGGGATREDPGADAALPGARRSRVARQVPVGEGQLAPLKGDSR